MYWILKGTVSVTSTDGEEVYAELNQGEFFGEMEYCTIDQEQLQ